MVKLTPPAIRPYMCTRCLKRQTQRRKFATSPVNNNAISPSSFQSPPPPPTSGAAKLTTRRLIFLNGRDASKFLQGLITNDVTKDVRNGYFAAFLNAQGKVLNDAFVYPISGSNWQRLPGFTQSEQSDVGFLIDVDATTLEPLLKVFKQHKLRAKLNYRALDEGELDVWSLWRGERWTAHGQQADDFDGHGSIWLTDSRAPGMGQRLLLTSKAASDVLNVVEEAPLSAYTIRRYLRGVPEGDKEIPRLNSLPMTYNIDIMGGIDFKKGCYSGQELTIRTHHTGVVRRRILPVMLYGAESTPPETLEYAPSTNIASTGLVGMQIQCDNKRQQSTGRLMGTVGNLGLGHCRIERMTDLVVSREEGFFQGTERFMVESPSGPKVGVKAFVPDWLRGKSTLR